MSDYTVLPGDCLTTLRTLPAESVHCVVTSPPYYGLRDYGNDAQIGLEPTPAAYVARLVEVFREVWRVLRPDGVVWLNLGDSYNGSGGAGGDYGPGGLKEGQPRYPGRRVGGLKPKDLIGVPWRVAFALQDDGWWLRSDIIWHKKAPMPESVTDRPTKAHEYVFLLTKAEKYFYDAEAIKEGVSLNTHGGAWTEGGIKQNILGQQAGGRLGNSPECGRRNKRSVWTLGPEPYHEAHFATMPTKLVEPCILAGTSAKGVCPQCGAQWVRVVERTDEIDLSAKGSRFDCGKTAVNGNGRVQPGERFTKAAVGWQPSCECNAGDPVPATVLDPFAGSGTTLAVALKHGRAAIGCELNPEYIDLIHQRCAEMSTEPIRVAGKVDDWSDFGLFADIAENIDALRESGGDWSGVEKYIELIQP